jgi:hypothetical protein
VKGSKVQVSGEFRAKSRMADSSVLASAAQVLLWRRGAEQTRGQNCRLENLHDTHLLDVLASQHHAFSIPHSFKSLYSDVLVDSKYAGVFRN